MSFASDVKDELCKIDARKISELKAECYGAWLFSKCYSLAPAHYISENGAVVRKLAELAAAAAGVSAEVSYSVSRRKKPAYKIQITDEDSRCQLLKCFGNDGSEINLRINHANFEDESDYASFLRGAFLSCGTVINPEKGYHLEFQTQYKRLSEDTLKLLEDIGTIELTPAIIERNGAYAVYFKDSAQIENFLTYIGATTQAMELMQVKMYKEALNNINRKTNFETANMDKTYSASARQVAAIARIADEKGLDSLPDELKEIAYLRLENAEMTLREIAEALHISKSGANHRLKKLLEMGQEIEEKTGGEQ